MYTTTTSQSSVRMGSGERAAEQPKHHEDRRLEDQNACVCLGHRRIADFADFTEHGTSISVQGSRFTVHGSRFTVHGSRFTVHGSRFTVHGSNGMACAGRLVMVAKRFQELVVWQLSRDLERRVFAFTAIVP